MDQFNQNPVQPIPPSQPIQPEPAETKGGIGPLVGSIIVIVILIIGAIYFWGGKLNRIDTLPAENNPAALSTNNEMGTIEADFLNTPDVEADLEGL